MRRFLSLVAAFALLLSATVAVRADGEADAKALLDKAIKAHGGADNLNKIKAETTQTKGKFYGLGDGIDYTGTVAYQFPNKVRVEVDSEVSGQKFKFTQIFNKDKGWTVLNDTVMDMDKDALAEARENLHANTVTRLQPAIFKDAKLEPLGEVKVNDKPAVGVRVEVKGYRAIGLYFDKDTHLLVKSETRGKDVQNGGGEFTTETFYSDFKKVGGVQMPYKITIKRDGKKFVDSEVTDYKPVDKIDDARFDKP